MRFKPCTGVPARETVVLQVSNADKFVGEMRPQASERITGGL